MQNRLCHWPSSQFGGKSGFLTSRFECTWPSVRGRVALRMEVHMKTLADFGAAIAFSALLVTSTAAFASNPTDLLTKATATVEQMKVDPAFSPARNMIDQAKGMLIIPNLTKGGFIIGAEGGDGVLVSKTPTGWSEPAFYGVSSASFGLQVGLEKAQIVM